MHLDEISDTDLLCDGKRNTGQFTIKAVPPAPVPKLEQISKSIPSFNLQLTVNILINQPNVKDNKSLNLQ